MRGNKAEFRCSFCGKVQEQKEQLERMIGGPGRVLICGECVALCGSILTDKRFPSSEQGSPSDIGAEGGDHGRAVRRAIGPLVEELAGVRAAVDALRAEVAALRDAGAPPVR